MINNFKNAQQYLLIYLLFVYINRLIYTNNNINNRQPKMYRRGGQNKIS